MGICALNSTSTVLPVGGRWLIEVETTDDDGDLTDDAPTVVVTLPAGSTDTATFETLSTGRFRAVYTVTETGRYIATVTTAESGVIDFSTFALAATPATGMPGLEDVVAYLDTSSWSDEVLQDALDAEAAAQRSVCRVSAIYPADLRQALLRRVARNLAMRPLPLAVQQGDPDLSVGILPGRDPEVRRLEGPYRKLMMG